MYRDDETATKVVEGNCIRRSRSRSSSNISHTPSILIDVHYSDSGHSSGNNCSAASSSCNSSISGETRDPQLWPQEAPSAKPNTKLDSTLHDHIEATNCAKSIRINQLDSLYLACAAARLQDEMESAASANKATANHSNGDESKATRLAAGPQTKRFKIRSRKSRKRQDICATSGDAQKPIKSNNNNQQPMNLSANAAFCSALNEHLVRLHHQASASASSSVSQHLSSLAQSLQQQQHQPNQTSFLFGAAGNANHLSNQSQSLITTTNHHQVASYQQQQHQAPSYLGPGASDLAFASLHSLSAVATALQKQQERHHNHMSHHTHQTRLNSSTNNNHHHHNLNHIHIHNTSTQLLASCDVATLHHGSSNRNNNNHDSNHLGNNMRGKANPQHQQQRPILIDPMGVAVAGQLNTNTNASGGHHSQQHQHQSSQSALNRRGRRRGSRKCRKMYGMEQRSLWCTQCKWKKACSRFCDRRQSQLAMAATMAAAISTGAQSISSRQRAGVSELPIDQVQSLAHKLG